MLESPHITIKTMLNLDERYHSYLDGSKKLRIDGIEEEIKAYGYTDNGSDIDGYYIITKNYKLQYNLQGGFKRMEKLQTLAKVA